MKIIDTHCHLNDEALFKDLDNVVSRAVSAGVDKMVVVGWDKASSELAIKISEQYDFIYAVIGFHPENIFDINDDILYETLNLYKHPKVVGIGEIGLDYHWDKEEDIKRAQVHYFEKQIEMANKHHLPIVIHSRDAINDTLTVVKNHTPKHGGILHCYAGSKEMVKDFSKLGLLFGIGGTVTFKNAITIKEVAKHVDNHMYVLETDAPYLAPTPHRGEMNHSKYLHLVA